MFQPSSPPKPLPFDPENPYVLVPLHQYPEFTFQCATLLNMEWPRSRQARLNTLWSCNKNFPVAMVLVKSDQREVIGFCKISLIPNVEHACFVESVVVHPEMRGKKLGTFLMRKLEDYILSRKLHTIYLSTLGQEKFYQKLGYDECEPVSLYTFGLNSKSPNQLQDSDSKTTKNGMCKENTKENVIQNGLYKESITGNSTINGLCLGNIENSAKNGLSKGIVKENSTVKISEENNDDSPQSVSSAPPLPAPSLKKKVIKKKVLSSSNSTTQPTQGTNKRKPKKKKEKLVLRLAPLPVPPPPPPLPKSSNVTSVTKDKTYMKKDLMFTHLSERFGPAVRLGEFTHCGAT